jgi:hypothetical protein
MDFYLFGPICQKGTQALISRLIPVNRTENIKRNSYDSLITEVNHLMESKQTFSCFVVDTAKYCGVELP